MRFNRFLMTTCAAICLALPAVSLADPPQDGNPRGDQKEHKPEKGGHAGEAGRQAGPGGRQSGAAVQGAHDERKATQDGGRAPHAAQGHEAARGQGPVGSDHGLAHGQGPTAPPAVHRGPVGPGVQAGRAPVVRQPPAPRAPPALTGWNRSARGPQRAQLGQQWRGQHQNWDQHAPWRGNREWWRSYPSFRLFTGARIGFFFFPDYGYISAPRQYRDHHWQAGDYLPRWFWRYGVKHYASYGLPRPPVGCAWIWLNGNVALVDRSDGYILDIVYNVW